MLKRIYTIAFLNIPGLRAVGINHNLNSCVLSPRFIHKHDPDLLDIRMSERQILLYSGPRIKTIGSEKPRKSPLTAQ